MAQWRRLGRPVVLGERRARAIALLLLLPAGSTPLRSDEPLRGDIMHVIGHYRLTEGYSPRTFTTAWANAWNPNGLGVHAEAHGIWREENAALLAGGLSWNRAAWSVQGMLGGSTVNSGILPEVYGRLGVTWRADPVVGLVLAPAFTYRTFRNGVSEGAGELQALQYLPAGPGVVVLQGVARLVASDPGRNVSPALGAGITYSRPQSHSLGLFIEGGRAAYDAAIGKGHVNDRTLSVRPSASLFLTRRLELVLAGEWTDRQSFQVLGAHAGLKLHFD